MGKDAARGPHVPAVAVVCQSGAADWGRASRLAKSLVSALSQFPSAELNRVAEKIR